MASPIKRLPPTTPEQRLDYWNDVEELIQNGFLTTTVRIGDIHLCFRNPQRQDFFFATHAHIDTKNADWKSYLISRCLWMANGIPLLEERFFAPSFVKILDAMVASSIDNLFSIILGLRKRYKDACKDVHSYVYESRSRLVWFNTGKRWPCDDSYIGIPGMQRLGANLVQTIWFSWNQQEDKRLEDEYIWQISKNEMACHAPKGVKKINAKDQEKTRNREAKRKKALDEFYYTKTGQLKEEEKKGTDIVDGVLLKSAKTVEDMQEEMRKWVSGEQDFHDEVVASYKNQVLHNLQEEDRQKEERLRLVAEAREKQMNDLGVTPKPLVGYTLGQIRELQKEKGQNPDGPNVGWIGYGSKRSYARDKWLTAQVSKGNLVEFNGRLITQEEYKKLNPKSLNEKVIDRARSKK